MTEVFIVELLESLEDVLGGLGRFAMDLRARLDAA
jgi:hypothetical protein